MSDYTSSGNPVDGTLGDAAEIRAEFALIQTAIASKANSAGQTFSGLVLANLGLTVAGADFASRGITDNATAKALTLSGSGANSITISNSATNPTIGTSGGNLDFVSITGAPHVRIGTSLTNPTSYLVLAGSSSDVIGINVDGATTDVSLAVATKGAGYIRLMTGYSEQVRVLPAADANRYITLTGSNGGNPTIGTSSGNLVITPEGNVAAQFQAAASSVNYLLLTGQATGLGVGVTATGTDANIQLSITSKGTSGIALNGGGATQLFINGVAGATNYATVTGSAGGNPKIATSAGSLDIGAAVVFTGQTVGTTIGAAGGASALPATPLGYITTSINGAACKIPYYNT